MILLGDFAGELMKRFVAGADREQSTLLPECLDDFIGENNPVRVIDAFVDALDLAGSGSMAWSRRQPAAVLSSINSPEALHLRLSLQSAVEPAARARGWPQRRGDVAVAAPHP